MEGYHESVLLREAVKALDVKKGKWYLDCTLGDGGHSMEIIRQGGNVVGIDVDPEALERVNIRFDEEVIDKSRYKLILGNFRDQTETVDRKFAGAIFDLGVSSLQLETPERGFSFGKMGPLDMRMDPSLQITALDLLKVLSRKELYELFKRLGEEKYSKRLAGALVSAREIRTGSQDSPNLAFRLRRNVKTTKDLADFVEKVVGGRQGKIHPATRVFQALRMTVNDELGALEQGLDQVKDLMETKSKIAVISFHSLEDRIVKNTFKNWQHEGKGRVLTKKPVVPGENEVIVNPRSRSAKLRIFERL